MSKYQYEYEEKLLAKIEEAGYIGRVTVTGVEFKTGVDTWIVDIRDAQQPDYATIKLFHKDLVAKPQYQNRKCGIPGYHLQRSGMMTTDQVIAIARNHINKFQSAETKRKNQAVMCQG